MKRTIFVSVLVAASLMIGFSSSANAWSFSALDAASHYLADKGADYAFDKARDYAKDRAMGRGNPGTSVISLKHAVAEVAFSPDGDGQTIIVNAIDHAKRQVLVQAYGFTNKAILHALVRAHRRGVDVKIILDKSNETQKYSGATYVANAGIPVWIDYKVAIAHNKVMIIDGDTVVTGSFNFTKSAQARNAENVLVLNNASELAAAYIKNWKWRLGESGKYRGAHQ